MMNYQSMLSDSNFRMSNLLVELNSVRNHSSLSQSLLTWSKRRKLMLMLNSSLNWNKMKLRLGDPNSWLLACSTQLKVKKEKLITSSQWMLLCISSPLAGNSSLLSSLQLTTMEVSHASSSHLYSLVSLHSLSENSPIFSDVSLELSQVSLLLPS